jgi:hypothetical protein
MAWRTESLLLELIKYREQELAADADTGGDEWLRAYVELADLQSELEFMRDNPAALDDPDALVYSPLKPRPHHSSGAIALPEPDEPDEPEV